MSFMQPMTLAKAAEFWREVAASMARGERALVIAEDEHGASSARRRWCGRRRRISRIAPTSPRCWCIGARAALGVGAAVLEAAERCRARGRQDAAGARHRQRRRRKALRTPRLAARRHHPELRADARRRALRHGGLLQKAGLTRRALVQQARASFLREHAMKRRDFLQHAGRGVRARLSPRVHARILRARPPRSTTSSSAKSKSSSSHGTHELRAGTQPPVPGAAAARVRGAASEAVSRIRRMAPTPRRTAADALLRAHPHQGRPRGHLRRRRQRSPAGVAGPAAAAGHRPERARGRSASGTRCTARTATRAPATS